MVEYLTFVVATVDDKEAIEVRYENIWLIQLFENFE